MKLYEVYHPDLNTNVMFKILSEQETHQLVSKYKDLPQEEFMRAVLEAVVYNLKSEVTAAIRPIPKEIAKDILSSLFNMSLMLNPGLDIMSWLQIANSPLMLSNFPMVSAPAAAEGKKKTARTTKKRTTPTKIPRTRFLNLDRYLKERIIGQDEAIDELVSALKRSYVGLNDEERPLGVFIFSGASGVGKTLIAKELHKYLFGDTEMVRIDCGEYQHKHENQKLIGSPPGYLAHEEGGQLTNALIENPNTVVLLDEIEKANPDIWNTFLRVFDEGWLTDGTGKKASFHNAIIIMTTNLGNKDIVNDVLDAKVGFKGVEQNGIVRDRVIRVTNEAIRKYFRPEFLNRIDKTVIFNHLTDADFAKIAVLELQAIETKLDKKGFILTYEDNVIDAMIKSGVSSVGGARGLSQIRRDKIENVLANSLLSKRHIKGTIFHLDYEDNAFVLNIRSPLVKKKLLELESGPTEEALTL